MSTCTFKKPLAGNCCVKCGRGLRRDYEQPPVVECEGSGLGDKVEQALAAIGVTPERYTEVKMLFGLPGTCGCGSRKRWLDIVGSYAKAVWHATG